MNLYWWIQSYSHCRQKKSREDCLILKVLTPVDWNQNILTKKQFSQSFYPQTFSYQDYKNASYTLKITWILSWDHSISQPGQHQLCGKIKIKIKWWKKFNAHYTVPRQLKDGGLLKILSPVFLKNNPFFYIYIYISQLAPCTSPNEMAHVVQKIASLTGSIHSGLDEQLVFLTAMEVTSLSISARSSKIRLLKAVSGPERFFFIKVLCQHPLQDSCQLFNIDIILQLRFGLNLN